MDDFFRTQQSPRGEAQMSSAFVSPPRNGPLLPRRFTTDSGRVPTLSTITAPPRGPESQDFNTTATLHKVQLLEKKRIEYEKLKEQKRRFEAEMQKLDHQQRQDERDIALMTEDLGRLGGHQSEPTTPPEYREPAFPSIFTRPNRYSTSSLQSPPGGLFTRPGRSGSQLASPQSVVMQSRFAFDDQLYRSSPGSRRNSDEDEKEEAVRQDPTSHRSTNALNRYSMPVTKTKQSFYDYSSLMDSGLGESLDKNDTTGYLFRDEESSDSRQQYSQVATETDGNFPTLIRQSAFPSMQQLNGSGSVTPQATDINPISTRPASFRHSLDLKFFNDNTQSAPEASGLASPSATANSNHVPKMQTSYSAGEVPTVKNSIAPGLGINANNHAQQHFHQHNASMGRIPASVVASRHTHARELSGSGDHNPGRIETSATYPSIGSALQGNAQPFGPTPSVQSAGSASGGASSGVSSPSSSTPYAYYNSGPNSGGYNNGINGSGMNGNGINGPNGIGGSGMNSNGIHAIGNGYMNGMNGANGMGGPNGGGMYSGSNVPTLAASMGNMSISGPAMNNMYHPANYVNYNPIYQSMAHTQPSPPRDSQARVIQTRRAMDNESMNRFQNMTIAQCGGQIYSYAKDQYGCRFLQKQLEQRNPEEVHMVWLETNQHIQELMIDPFGNYLCQKLLELCNDDDRTVLIRNAAPEMVAIALNQHGTRALQKMIEFVSTQEQVNIIIGALGDRVVDLIQDLNGNHVIQKCLTKLQASDAQFIFDSVGQHCFEVGSHRHGCCVLQRCIDHASGPQKKWLIHKITENSVSLVQDPFGNYVVQYIIDLNEPSFTEPLVATFRGRVCALSRHKFSSNVMEKCMRCSQEISRDMIVDEMLVPGEMEKLLRDPYANYVVQTALEYASPRMKQRVVDTLRPILPGIRTTPHGRRLSAKVQSWDTQGGSANPGGQFTPADEAGGQISQRQVMMESNSSSPSVVSPGGSQPVGSGSVGGIKGGPAHGGRIGGANGRTAFPSSHTITVPPPTTAIGPPRGQPPRAAMHHPYMSLMGGSMMDSDSNRI